jgi:hypothetical protein
MIEQASLVIGNGNWAVKSDNLLGYKLIDGKYYPRDMSVVRATTGTRVNEDGLVEVVPYNLFQYSQDFTNGVYSPNNITATANQTTAPDGTLTADKLTEDTSNSFHRIVQSATGTGTYTISYYVKANGRTRVAIFTPPTDVGFNLLTDEVINIGYGTSGASIENVGNDWHRVSLTFAASGSASCYIGLMNNSNQVTYTGDGTSGIYVWGAQLEAGSYPTSYIPTTSASVTRNADVISKTGISSLIGQTEGTIFVDLGLIKSGPLGADFGSIDDGTSQNRIHFFLNTSNQYGIYSEKLGATQWYFVSSVSPTGNDKLAIAYANNDAVLYINGTQAGSTNTFSVPATTAFRLNDRYDNAVKADVMQIKAEALWPTRLTNTQLAQLTTI